MNTKPNILIVDDIDANLFLLESILKKLDFNLIKASSGFEALGKSKGIELALALVDVWMPEMNGYDLAVKLNEERADDKVPVIFLTANFGDEDEIFRGYNSGAVDYIIKPINNEILIKKVNVFIELFNQKQTVIKNAALLKKNAEELKSSIEQLHKLTQYIDKVREDERVAISRELHDDLGQALTAIKIDLGIIKQITPDSKATLKINKVIEDVRNTIITVQKLTARLRPQIIDDLGLEAAIEWYSKEFAQRNKMEVFLHFDTQISISPDVSLSIFRIMQESLTNISRYSKASRVDIGLKKTDQYYVFNIADNGIGITKNKINSKTSFGIIGMKERTAGIGGSFEIYHGKEKGTEISITIPLKK